MVLWRWQQGDHGVATVAWRRRRGDWERTAPGVTAAMFWTSGAREKKVKKGIKAFEGMGWNLLSVFCT
ncbi:hypothetical protein C1H46_021605 [Malus baccata]|uniref:Uncharacterized protein n=1 Tax=Malus baccata TaxID=106549 RepID=A0A540M2K3_MALBA|nr:hypothetical protein C1H46_021605 [Malus baccata]